MHLSLSTYQVWSYTKCHQIHLPFQHFRIFFVLLELMRLESFMSGCFVNFKSKGQMDSKGQG